ncbi:MAG: zf-TFIIB domain-containing protein [Candidatus Saccharimonas sp.]
MKCPNDQTTLLITERQNIEIDYCPECRGVWLDRGELDKLIASSNTEPTIAQKPEPVRNEREHYNYSDRPRESYDDRRYKKKRRESFLEDLFDF